MDLVHDDLDATEQLWRRPATLYALAGLLLGLLMIGHTSNQMWSGTDFWLWLGSVREFAERPFAPLHPVLAVDSSYDYPSYMLGPYSFVVGMVVRVTGVGAVTALSIAGIGNLALVLSGIWSLTKRVSQEVWAPLLALVFTLVAWGSQPWRWSGYMNLNALGSVLPLGSTFAVGLGLFCLSLLWDWLRGKGDSRLVLLTIVFPGVVLTHQPTGLWVALICLGFTVARWKSVSGVDVMKLVVAVLMASALVLAWPFFSLTDLMSDSHGLEDINQLIFRRVMVRSVLAVPGLVALVYRFRRSCRDPLVFAALAVGVPFGIAWVLQIGTLGRVFPGVMLVAHLAMADWFAKAIREARSARSRRELQVALIGVIALGLIGTAPGWLRSVPRSWVPAGVGERLQLHSVIGPYLGFGEYMTVHDVAAAPLYVSLAIGGSSAKVIGVAIDGLWIDDHESRREDNRLILDPMTGPEQRELLLKKYGVDFVVVEKERADEMRHLVPGSVLRGQVDRFVVIAVPQHP